MGFLSLRFIFGRGGAPLTPPLVQTIEGTIAMQLPSSCCLHNSQPLPRSSGLVFLAPKSVSNPGDENFNFFSVAAISRRDRSQERTPSPPPKTAVEYSLFASDFLNT